MANDRWDDEDPYRPRRYGNDEEYERNFWQDNESRGRPRRTTYPMRRYKSMPVLGMDMGGPPRGPGDWRNFDERDADGPGGGYARDTDWSNRGGARGLDWSDRDPREGRGRGSSQRADRDDPWGRRRERTWWDRTQDEVRSWMGDLDAERRREIDYRGRGPRGYTRSDERIREDVSDWLMEDRYIDASEIDVTVSNGEVTLAGTVDSREAKRRAEDIAASAMGVKDVHNTLRLRGARTGAGAIAGASTGAGASSSGSEGNETGGVISGSNEPRH